MKPVKIKIDPKNRKAHVDSILEYLRSERYYLEPKNILIELGFYSDDAFAITALENGSVMYTNNVDLFIGSKSEEIFITPTKDKQ